MQINKRWATFSALGTLYLNAAACGGAPPPSPSALCDEKLAKWEECEMEYSGVTSEQFWNHCILYETDVEASKPVCWNEYAAREQCYLLLDCVTYFEVDDYGDAGSPGGECHDQYEDYFDCYWEY